MRYDILPAYTSQFDVGCLTETKTENIPSIEFPNFEIFSKKQKSKAHGIAVFVKSGLFPTILKIENTKSKCVLWVALGFSPQKIQLIVGGVYIPGSNSKYSDANDYDIISEDIVALNSKYKCPFVLLGDFNSRTGKLDDFLLQNTAKESFQNLNIETKRYNCDDKIDGNGRNLINLCNDFNLGILNGRFGKDKNIGQFTCVKTIGQSVVDYVVTSATLFPFVLDFYVDNFDNCMSDVHLPLCTTLKLESEYKKQNEVINQNFKSIEYKASWKNEKKVDYQQAFSNEKILSLTEKLGNLSLSENISQEKIDFITTELTNIIVEPAKQVGICKKYAKNNSRPRKNPRKPWFNESCEQERKKYFKEKNSLWSSKSVNEKSQCMKKMKEKGKSYKKFIAKVQKSYDKKFAKV